MARVHKFVVGPHDAHLRLDRYLVSHLPKAFSRAAIQRAIRDGAVSIEGRAAKAHRHLRAGEAIVTRLTVGREPLSAAPGSGQASGPEPIPLEVVYEDEQVLVVNKPPHLVTHPAPGHWSGTLVNAILWHLYHASGSKLQASDLRLQTPGSSLKLAACSLQPALPRAGIVHRLDKDTSGLLVVAKTALALRELAKQLKARAMSRRYLALVEGHVACDEGTITASVGRHLKDRVRMTIRYLGGREAVTHYRVLKRFVRPETRDQRQGTQDPSITSHVSSLMSHVQSPFLYTLLEVRLETGRTHQIRVHLAHLRHPVLGDAVYGRHPRRYWDALGIARQLLHAYAVRFVHPTTQQPLEVTVGIPADMTRWLSGCSLNTTSLLSSD